MQGGVNIEILLTHMKDSNSGREGDEERERERESDSLSEISRVFETRKGNID
jgi:hypothetical protein